MDRQHPPFQLEEYVSATASAKLDRAHTETMVKQMRIGLASAKLAEDYPDLAGWYCLRLRPGREFAAQTALKELGVDLRVPRRPGGVVVRRGRKWELPDKPWMPGYGMVRCVPSVGAFSGLIDQKDYVVDVVGGLMKPFRFTGLDIDKMEAGIAALIEAERRAGEPYPWRKGQMALIAGGPFIGFTGTVLAVQKERLRISVSVNGKAMEITLPKIAVKAFHDAGAA